MKKPIMEIFLFLVIIVPLFAWANYEIHKEDFNAYEKLAIKAAFIQQMTGKEITPEQAEWVNISMVLTDISLNADSLDIFLANGRKKK